MKLFNLGFSINLDIAYLKALLLKLVITIPVVHANRFFLFTQKLASLKNLVRFGRPFDSLIIEKNHKETVKTESKKRRKGLTYFKRNIAKLHTQYTFDALRAIIEEVAEFGEKRSITGSQA